MKKKKSLNEGYGIWGIATPKSVASNIKLSKLAKEAWEPTKQEEPTMSPEQKQKFMEAISNFAQLSDSIRSEEHTSELQSH